MNGGAATNPAVSPAEFAGLLGQIRRRQWRSAAVAAPAVALLGAAFAYAGAFDLARYADAAPTIVTLCRDSMPPDFARWREWGRPLLETLATGVAGTVLGAALALPLASLAARNVGAPRCWRSTPCVRFRA
jgi:phosphonate transport system permease protein